MMPWPRRHARAEREGQAVMILRKAFMLVALAGLVVAPAAQAQPVLKVGSTPTGIPFTFLDTKTNTIQGVMVDLVTAVGKDAGFAVTIEPMQFSTLIASLTSGKIDLISAAMYITPARKEVIDFSEAVYSYGEGLVVTKADTKDYASFADLKGETVGAQVGTVYVEPLKKTGLFADVKIYDTIPDILRDVNTGRLKAGFADYPILAYNLQQGLFPEVRLVKSYKATILGSIGIGVRKSDGDLLKKVDAALAKLKADGSLKQILAKWGLE
jgi:polar amino acid transport system substrate-binding protein